MMATVTVNSEHSYQVLIDCDWQNELSRIAKDRTRIAVVVPPSLRSRIEGLFLKSQSLVIFEIPEGEGAKSSTTLLNLWDQLAQSGFTRSDLIVAIGGGTATDIAGFAAATWLRGIDWVAIPTTLAGMVDAAIGGKTGMNTSHGKNLIGAFHSPILVCVDLSWLQTLSDRDFCAGMAEVVKTGFIVDTAIVELIEGKEISAIRASHDLCVELIARSVQVKAATVSSDFKESFDREILNYGHTLGHAIELHSEFTLRHGEAVSIGMVYVAQLAQIRGVLSTELVERHRAILTGLNLPITYSKQAWPFLLKTIALDKKARGKSIRFVAIEAIGKTLRLEDLTTDELTLAYERIST